MPLFASREAELFGSAETARISSLQAGHVVQVLIPPSSLDGPILYLYTWTHRS